jgi:HPt (histidine-containing phosphotransfer) domain-containing protein
MIQLEVFREADSGIRPISPAAAGLQNEIVASGETILDTEQLRDITMQDGELMRGLLKALLDDTARQAELLEGAIGEGNARQCIRLAHYSKGACLNLGANRAAGIFKQIEKNAAVGQFAACSQSLACLARELDLLRSAALALE